VPVKIKKYIRMDDRSCVGSGEEKREYLLYGDIRSVCFYVGESRIRGFGLPPRREKRICMVVLLLLDSVSR